MGTAGTFTVSTAHEYPSPPTISLTGGTLPAGVTFVDNRDGTATLSGTPAAGTGGVYDLSITAANGAGVPSVQAFTLTVDEAPAITSATGASLSVGSAGSFSVTTTGYPTPVLTMTARALPSGVTFVDNGDGTATLSGAPAVTTGGVYALSITAGNGVGSPSVQAFTLTVDEAPSFSSAGEATFTANTLGSFIVTTIGYPTLGLTENGALPTGITFTDNGNGTATLSGTPARGSGGVYDLSITGSDGAGAHIVEPFTLTVDEAPDVTSAAATTFTVGAAGSFSVTTIGYPTPVLTLTAGALPSGVTFVDNGDGSASLFGTPTVGTGGAYELSIAAGNGVGLGASQQFTLTVNEAGGIVSSPSAVFTVGTAGTFSVATAHEYPPPTISLKSGTLPKGVGFTDNGDGTATLSGAPAAGTGGVYDLEFTASNGTDPASLQAFTLTVDQAPAITSASATTFSFGTAGSFSVTTTGYPTPVLTLTAGTLPAGVTFADNGDGTGTLSGAPSGTGGVEKLTITASNGTGTPAVQSFELTVATGASHSAQTVLSITSGAGTTFTVGSAGSFSVTTNGGLGVAFAETGTLPPGVDFTDNGDGTATLSGPRRRGRAGCTTSRSRLRLAATFLRSSPSRSRLTKPRRSQVHRGRPLRSDRRALLALRRRGPNTRPTPA